MSSKAATERRFPRVLIVTKSQIGDVDSAGAALRSWFKEWPRDQLAQVFSGVPLGSHAFCGQSFHLGPEERRLGRLFFRLKGSSLADAALPYRARTRGGAFQSAKQAVGRILVDSGAWELIFAPRLSERLVKFVDSFRPEALFVQGCDIGFMRLPLLISARCGAPIHFDIVDDWVMHLYRGWPLGLMNGVVRRTFSKLAHASARRYTIGDMMAETYRERYGLDFTPLLQCDDQERFTSARVGGAAAGSDTVEIVYSGSLALRRWESLLDLAEACSRARVPGKRISITAYVPFVPPEAAEALRSAPCLTVKQAVPDAEVPRVLANAGLLFLPESFDRAIGEYIRLSVSTKAHLYMMSGRPALVYGPAGTGTVEYARSHGWAYVVDRPGPEGLVEALQDLLGDERRCLDLTWRAAEVAAARHVGAVVREKLRRALLSPPD